MLTRLRVLFGGLLLLSSAATLAREPDKSPPEKSEKPLPADVVAILENADEFQLLSLKPLSQMRGGTAKWGDKERFRDEGVVGKVILKDAKERQRIIEALYGAIRGQEHRASAGCFWPHHGIRARKGDKAVDIVICFHCSQAYVHTDKGKGHRVISDLYHFGREFDVVLTRHGVRLEE
jgi:hypothetical protein